MIENLQENIVYYDAECKLCHQLMQSVKKQDEGKKFAFMPLQKSTFENLNSLIYIKNGKTFYKSDAAIKIVEEIKSWKFIAFILKIFPRFLRNIVYNIIAKFRHRM